MMASTEVPLMVIWMEVPANPAEVGSGKLLTCTIFAGPIFCPKTINREPCAMPAFGNPGSV